MATAGADDLSEGEYQPEDASDYAFGSPLSSVHRRDEDEDSDDDDDNGGGGLLRGDDDEELMAVLRQDAHMHDEDGGDNEEDAGNGDDAAGGGEPGNAAAAAVVGGGRPKPPALSSLSAVRFPTGCAFVLLTLRTTGGRNPRAVALASRWLEWDGTEGPADFCEYILTSRTPSKEAAAQIIDGVSMATVHRRLPTFVPSY